MQQGKSAVFLSTKLRRRFTLRLDFCPRQNFWTAPSPNRPSVMVAFIEKSTIKNAMVGLRSHISEGCVIEDTLLMGADFYENKAVCASKDDCFMPLGVGPGSTIKNAIVDKNARIGANCSITNKNNVETDVETGKGCGLGHQGLHHCYRKGCDAS